MKPILKWTGGKTALLPEIVKRLPKKWGTYYEPFAGGAALFFHLEPAKAVLGDMNDNVINTYRSLAHAAGVVDLHLDDLIAHHGKRHYYKIRAVWNRTFWSQTPLPPLPQIGDRWTTRAAHFLYLNRTCFNGLWRENKRGKMNTPMGRYKTISRPSPEDIDRARLLLQRADLRVGPFWMTLHDAKRGDFVYCDSPYAPVSKTASFVSYGRDGFNDDDQIKLAEVARDLRKRGVNVMLSNSDTPRVRQLYRGFRIERVTRPGTMNSNTEKRGRVSEVIIRGY